MKLTIDLKFFIPAILSFIVAYMTVTSTIDNYIAFAGEDNAMGFFFMSTLMGVICLFCSFEKAKS
jgi:hypothetical protein|tara:strand:- start:1096 stop:1290 length:195 start_codon:yes stop_codon:yes gene_type:complete